MTTTGVGPLRRARRRAARWATARVPAAALLVLLWGAAAIAHDLVDPGEAQQYLERVSGLSAAIAAAESVDGRTEALFALGETVHAITEHLNRDRGAHGGELGLAGSALVSELRARGITLAWWPTAQRYRSYVGPFEEYVALRPDGPRWADAHFRILEGRFYDSFVSDPFQPGSLDWPGLLAQIRDGEALRTRDPDHRHREETLFILAVNYLRAARQAPDAASRQGYRARAETVVQELVKAHPDSLRAAAARTLLERAPAPD